jgi:uroporphyrinogen-III synthase
LSYLGDVAEQNQPETGMPRAVAPSFRGARVLSFESRRATEVAALITTFGGQPLIAPALREVPIESNTAAVEFAHALTRGELDAVVFLTGVGVRALVAAVEAVCPRPQLAAALALTKVVARGPKPVAVLRELGVPVWVSVPEPNTWREMLTALDAKADEFPLEGARVAVQEYGVSNPELLAGLRERGARVTAVPVYQWTLPEDTAPLEKAVTALCDGAVDVVLFTSGVQIVHLWKVAGERHDEVRQGLARAFVASIGPTTSEELRRHGLIPGLEASHPKMGLLVREAAAHQKGGTATG